MVSGPKCPTIAGYLWSVGQAIKVDSLIPQGHSRAQGRENVEQLVKEIQQNISTFDQRKPAQIKWRKESVSEDHGLQRRRFWEFGTEPDLWEGRGSSLESGIWVRLKKRHTIDTEEWVWLLMEDDRSTMRGSNKLFFSIKGVMWDPVNGHWFCLLRKLAWDGFCSPQGDGPGCWCCHHNQSPEVERLCTVVPAGQERAFRRVPAGLIPQPCASELLWLL